MTRALRLVPNLGTVALVFALRTLSFDPARLRPVTLGLALLTGGCAAWLAKRREASAIDAALTGFALLGAAGIWLWPGGLGQAMAARPTAWLFGTLLAAATVPQLAGREPFTAFFARRRAPEAVWETGIFRGIVGEMAWVWAGLFALALLLSLAPALVGPWLSTGWGARIVADVAPLALLAGVGIPFNRRYPAYRMRRLGFSNERIAPAGTPAVGCPGTPNPRSPKEKNMRQQRNIVAINGSPHRAVGNTSRMLEMLRGPLSEAGFEFEEIFLADREIRFCAGCAVCLEKGACWIRDDHREVANRLLEADAVILASPVYFLQVTAQMKTFLDRSLGLGHKPRGSWKPGLAVAVSAGMGETAVADYLGGVLRAYGAFSVGSLTAIGVGPGGFLGEEAVRSRATQLAGDLVRAVDENRRYPATDRDLHFWQFMGGLVRQQRDLMAGDYEHWERLGLFEGFEAYVGHGWTRAPIDTEARKAWVRGLIAGERDRTQTGKTGEPRPERTGPPNGVSTCRELLEAMPTGFHPEAADGFRAVYQFNVPDEGFVAHLEVADRNCTFHEGPAETPDVVVETPGSVWLAVSRGELDGQEAFLSGKYRVKGDLERLTRLKDLFG